MKRPTARRDRLQPLAYQAERSQLAQGRRQVFVVPVERHNRAWQADFSEFETGAEGTWRLGGIADLIDEYSKERAHCALGRKTPTSPSTWRLTNASGIYS